jgi:hypothetical protein
LSEPASIEHQSWIPLSPSAIASDTAQRRFLVRGRRGPSILVIDLATRLTVRQHLITAPAPLAGHPPSKTVIDSELLARRRDESRRGTRR